MMNHGSRTGVNESVLGIRAGLRAGGENELLARAVSEVLGAGVVRIAPCSGGDINLAFRLDLDDGRAAFLKTRAGASGNEFRAEAAGLSWLSEPGGLPVPTPLAVIETGPIAGLLIEWIEPCGPLSADGQVELGSGLAKIHLAGAEAHGFGAPGALDLEVRLGEAVLVAPAGGGSDATFAEVYSLRIEALARQARDAGGLDPEGAAVIMRVADRLADFCGPPGPPARLHGDLWSGNVMAGPDGRPWLIDPAAYGGDPEVDLAMLRLFGSPSARFFDAYFEVNPLPDGYGDRIRLWQIQPLLVHAVLFGGHYGRSAVRAAAGYLNS